MSRLFFRTIPNNPANCDDFDCNNDIEFGMHESYDYYLDCTLRRRNMGLFTADRVSLCGLCVCICMAVCVCV